MENIKTSKIIKVVAYILVPILTLIILINTFTLIYCSIYKDDINYEISSYYDTSTFAENYLYAINRATSSKISKNEIIVEKVPIQQDITYFDLSQNEGYTIKLSEELKNTENIEYSSLRTTLLDILIITNDGKIYTNIEKTIKTDTVEELKQYINLKDYTWIYENGKITTDIKKLNYDEIAYTPLFENIQDKNCNIYACLRNPDAGEIHVYNIIYKIISKTYASAPTTITISSIILLLLIIYIIISIGHKKDYEGIYTTKIDKIELELIGIIGIALIIIEAIAIIFIIQLIKYITNNVVQNSLIDSLIILLILLGIILYITIATCVVTFIRRIKAKILWKNTIMYKIGKSITRGVILNNKSTSSKLAIIFIGVLLVQLALLFVIVTSENLIFLIILIAFWYMIFRYLLEKQNAFNEIRKKINQIYNGETGNDLNEDNFERRTKRNSKGIK